MANAPRSRASARWWRQMFWRLLQLLAGVHLVLQVLVWVPLHWSRTDSKRDLPIYYNAAQAAYAGRPMYKPYPHYNPSIVPNRYFYPPPFAAALSRVAGNPGISELAFARVWYALLLCAFWFYAWCLVRLAGRRGLWPVLVAGLALILWPGCSKAMSFGNAEPVMWALLGGALALSSAAWRGGLLATAALIKIHPVLALAAAFRREGRSYQISSVATFIAGLLLGVAICGVESFAAWRAAAGPVASQGTFLGNNLSLSFAGLRLAVSAGWLAPDQALPLAARVYLLLCGVTAPLAALWFTRNSELKWRQAIIISVTILFAPLCWDMYLPVLMLPLALYLGKRTPPATVS